MEVTIKISSVLKIIVPIILIIAFLMPGCTSAPRLGWAGTIVDGNKLFIASMDGTVRVFNLDNEESFEGGTQSLIVSTSDGFYGRPAILNGKAYLSTYSGQLNAIDSTGGREPPYSLGKKITVVGGVAVDISNVYVGTSEGILYSVSADLKTVNWTFPSTGNLGGKIWGTPVVDVSKGVVYFGCLNRKMYAIDINTHQELAGFSFEAEGAIASTPVLVGDTLYFGTFDRKFYAINKSTGSIRWVFSGASSWYWTEALIDSGNIYVGSLDGKVYQLDIKTGVKKSEFNTKSPINSSPVLSGEVLIVATNSGLVYGLDASDIGKQKWGAPYNVKEQVQASMSVHNGVVYIMGRMGTVLKLNAQNGAYKGKVNLSV
ncbi:MAG: PQQ-binding-like beta-propeller repeat protein [Chloroflexi bacterium]|nr:PQQ-binding-like beta-propeller repeat protein [Chloroflexota bacterium]